LKVFCGSNLLSHAGLRRVLREQLELFFQELVLLICLLLALFQQLFDVDVVQIISVSGGYRL
jgi:hypothetical protein